MTWAGRRVTVMGLGHFGGGVGTVRYFSQQGARVLVTDLQPPHQLTESLAEIAPLANVDLRLGGHRPDDFTTCDLVVASPAISSQHPLLEQARAAGVAVTREMNLFWELNPARTVCITGSNGKSTTAATLFSILEHLFPGRCVLGGNIGVSLLPIVHELTPDHIAVLELSSFQLEDLAPLRPNPHVAVVTNFSPNHLDRHGTLDAYRAAKQNLLRWQTPDRIAVLNQDDPDVSTWHTAAEAWWFGRGDDGRRGLFAIGLESLPRRVLYRAGMREQVLPLADWLRLPGPHNFNNALAAVCAALALGAEPRHVQLGVEGFGGLPHRLELVAETAGRRFYNDSKATTPEAAALALQSFRAPLLLIAGGYDKQVDLDPLAQAIRVKTPRAVATIGQTGPALAARLAQVLAPGSATPLTCAGDLRSAFAWLMQHSAPGDVVLLSPGCASYDQFPNYTARGDLFRNLALAWRPDTVNPVSQ